MVKTVDTILSPRKYMKMVCTFVITNDSHGEVWCIYSQKEGRMRDGFYTIDPNSFERTLEHTEILKKSIPFDKNTMTFEREDLVFSRVLVPMILINNKGE